jgi:hypothetical protein
MKGLTLKILMFGVTLILSLSIKAPAHALSAEITVANNSVAVGDSLRLQVTVKGSATATPPEINSEGLQIVYRGPSTIRIFNGKYSASIILNYSVLGVKAGAYTLGPLTVKVGRKTIRTNSVTITVTPAAAPAPGRQSAPPTVADDDSSPVAGQLQKRLFLTLDLPRSTFYAGETIKAAIRLYVGGVRVDEVHYPVIKATDGYQVAIGKPAKLNENINGISYEVLEFPTTISFIKTGKLTFGPATLQCIALAPRQARNSFFDSFFDDYEEYPQILTSKVGNLTVQPLPPQPDGFTGGIGRFNLEVSAAPQEVLAGDPVTVKLTVTGQGNLANIAPPTLPNQAGLKVYAAQPKTGQKAAIASSKTVFEQIVFPLNERITTIGPYSLTYFDPAQGAYRTARTTVIPIKVKPNPNFNLAPSGAAVSATADQLGQGLVYIKNSPGRLRLRTAPLHRQLWFWLLQTLPFGAILIAFYYRKYREFQNSATPLSRAARADRQAGRQLAHTEKLLNNAEYERFLDELHRIFREYLADKFHLAAGGITGAVVSQLKTAGIEEELLHNIANFFAQYDLFRFTGAKITKVEAERLLELVVTVVTTNRRKAKGRRRKN